jgi:serine/threonine protein kinase
VVSETCGLNYIMQVKIIANLRHPNIVLFMGVCLSPPCLITEYCPQGSLLDVLQRAHTQRYTAAQLTWARRLKMALQVAKVCMLFASAILFPGFNHLSL